MRWTEHAAHIREMRNVYLWAEEMTWKSYA